MYFELFIIFILIMILFCIYHLFKSNKYLNDTITEMKIIHTNKISELETELTFNQNYFIAYEKIQNIKFEENNKVSGLKSNYFLLKFSTKVKNTIFFVRIVLFRKIVNSLLNNIINKYKDKLRKTSAIFYDYLKPKDNFKQFSIIYCPSNIKLNEVESSRCNIIIDFLMFIHDYSSNKIHLNKIENSNEIIKIINKNNGNNSGENTSLNKKDEISLKPGVFVDYVFILSFSSTLFFEDILTLSSDSETENISPSSSLLFSLFLSSLDLLIFKSLSSFIRSEFIF